MALVATGLRAGQALAAVLLYRLASFWLAAFAGWLVFLWLRHTRRAARPTAPSPPCRPSGLAAHRIRTPTGTEIILPGVLEQDT